MANPISAALAKLAQGTPAPQPTAAPANPISQALAGLSRQVNAGSSGDPYDAPIKVAQPRSVPRGTVKHSKPVPQKKQPKGKLSQSDIAYALKHNNTTKSGLKLKAKKSSGLLGGLDTGANLAAPPLQSALHALGYGGAAVGAVAAGAGRKVANDVSAASHGDFSFNDQLARDTKNKSQVVKDTKKQTGTGQYLERSTKNGANPVARIGAEAVGTVPAAGKAGITATLRALALHPSVKGLGKQFDADQSAYGKRIVGAVGDVARDPLTYLAPEAGLEGAAADRTTLAARFAEPEVVEKLGVEGSKDAQLQAIRRGAGGIDKEYLAALNEPQKGGLYIGKGDNQLRVLPKSVTEPLTAPIRALKTYGNDAFDKIIPDSLRSAGSKGEVELEQLGRSGDNVAGPLQQRIRKGAEITGTARIMPDVHAAVAATKDLAPEAEGKVINELESYSTLKAPSETATKVREVLDSIRDKVNEGRATLRSHGVNEPDMGHVEDYFPHRSTDEAKAWFAERGQKFDGSIGAQLQYERRLKPGADFFGQTIPEGTEEDLRNFVNHVFKENTGSDLFDKTSLKKIVGSYAEAARADITRTTQAAEEIRLGVRKLDPAAAAQDAAKAARGASGDVADSTSAWGKAQAPSFLNSTDPQARASLDAAQAARQRADSITETLKGNVVDPQARQAAIDHLTTQRDALQGLRPSGADSAAASAGETVSPLEAKIKDVNDQLDALGKADKSADPLHEARKAAVQEEAGHLKDAKQFADKAAAEADPEVKRSLNIESDASQTEAEIAKAGIKDPTPEEARVHLSSANHVAGLLDASEAEAKHELDQFPRDPDVQEAMDKIAALKKDPAKTSHQLTKMYDAVLNWQKASQVASVGFNIKVAMGGLWNVGALQGAKLQTLKDTIEAWKAAADPETWAKFVEEKPTVADAYERTRPLGARGQIRSSIPHGDEEFGREVDKSNFAIPRLPGRDSPLQLANPLSRDFALFKGTQRAGEGVENLIRSWSAIDTILKGGSDADAYAAVNKYMFDYAAKSATEKNIVQRIVPFYTWTRRNVPLQIQSLAEKPKAFSIYNDITRNLGGTKALPNTPDYVTGEAGGIPLKPNKDGTQKFITPPLPLEDIQALPPINGGAHGVEDYVGGQLSPLVKTPFEAFTNQQLFKNLPLSNKEQELPATWGKVPGLPQALQALGMANKRGNKWAISQKNAYIVEQLVPLAGKTRRLAPGQGDALKKKQASAAFSYLLGSVARTVTPEDRAAFQFFANKDKVTSKKNELKPTAGTGAGRSRPTARPLPTTTTAAPKGQVDKSGNYSQPDSGEFQGPTKRVWRTGNGEPATEIKVTVGEDGHYYNIPTLVPGLPHLDKLLKTGKPTPAQVKYASEWARKNNWLGQDFPDEKSAIAYELSFHKGLDKKFSKFKWADQKKAK